MRKTAWLIIASIILNFFWVPANADDYDTQISTLESQKQQKQSEYQQTQERIEQLKKQQEDLSKKLKDLSGQLWTTQTQLDDLSSQIDETQQKLTEVEANLKDRQEKLNREQEFRNSTIRNYYKHSHTSVIELLLASDKFSETAQNTAFQTSMLDQAKRTIASLNTEIAQFEENKKNVEQVKKDLEDNLIKIASLKKQLQSQASQTQKQINETAAQKNALTGQLSSIQNSIKDLTAQQQTLIAQKLAATSQFLTVGDVAQAIQSLPTPGFSPAYAFFTYGYPHRVGMNQYGAYGRALVAKQDFQTILKAYYGMEATVANVPTMITVNGCNDYGQCFNNESFAFDDYLKHLYEMPGNWPAEALKAQAVAARTYAMRYGSVICPSQSCQEVKKEVNTTAWQQAVDATAGLILGGNNPIAAYYSSTDGGYTCTDFYHNNPCTAYLVDAVDGKWSTQTAYDGPNYGNSPWFHKAWGDNQRGNAWMTEEETEDIFNAILLSQKSSSYNQYLTQPDRGGWSFAQVKDALAKEGVKEIGMISAITTFQDGAGNTSNVAVTSADYGTKTFDGATFKSMFNLRSLGTLAIWTSLYDVVRQ
ncbi:MAG: hypothetical protein M1150_03740 [Patescibacteria group bacterium]|nr:hypothetical protein [Patescibacteria group bacterium]